MAKKDNSKKFVVLGLLVKRVSGRGAIKRSQVSDVKNKKMSWLQDDMFLKLHSLKILKA